MTLRVVPVGVRRARQIVEAMHAHHHAPPGALFCVGVADDDRLACVAIVSSPVVAEVTRCASDRTPHAASMAIAAATRAAVALGYRRLVSYTLLGEAGTSYRAAGWVITGLVEASQGWHSRPGRTTTQGGAKVRWETGPDALPADGAAALVAALCTGRVEIPARRETLPLLQGAA